MANTNSSPYKNDWHKYHGDDANSGYVVDSDINSDTAARLKVYDALPVNGPILSVPAIVDNFVYFGIANSHKVIGTNGGSFYKYDIQQKKIVNEFNWVIKPDEADTHGFTGMGTTPAIDEANDRLYFSAFDGKAYCLRMSDLSCVWVTDLRNADPDKGQPVTNDANGGPVAAGWSSPTFVGDKVYVGIGEGENPYLYSFMFCLDAPTGNVNWIFCTCPFEEGKDNPVNMLPAQVVQQPLPPSSKFSVYTGSVVTRGCSPWSSPAYDEGTGNLYFCTGNPVPDGNLPSAQWSNGLMALNAETGDFVNFFQALPESMYRETDVDVDVGGSPMLFDYHVNSSETVRAVGFGCKDGGFFILHADTFELIKWRQLLPYYNYDPTQPLPYAKEHVNNEVNIQIPTVDPHSNNPQPGVTIYNSESNCADGENYSGVFGVAAILPDPGYLYVCLGGPNYHAISAGIDYRSTPFMRAIQIYDDHLTDAWPMVSEEVTYPYVEGYTCSNPDTSNEKTKQVTLEKYANVGDSMYRLSPRGQYAESGISSPAVVNDVVFCTTTGVGIYCFHAHTGDLLWNDFLGSQTGGYNGGYGFCMGPAIAGNFVVAGALIASDEVLNGGILKIYTIE